MSNRAKSGAVIAGITVAIAATGPARAAAPSRAGCVGQFFSSHAGLVPATGGEESVGGFISQTARAEGQAFGQEISGARNLPREDCGL